jgi:hypothetical protein
VAHGATKHQIPVERLIEFNFPGSVIKGRVNPAIVNWYLHYHEGFDCPETHDHINRKFEGGERLAIPHLGNVEIGEGRIVPKPPRSLDEPGEILASEKFTYEWKIPPKGGKEVGYFLLQARITVEGELKKHKGLVKTAFKKDQIKLALEKKFDHDLKGTFSIKGDEKTLETIVKSWQEGGKWGFFKAIAAPFELSLKQAWPTNSGITIVPEVGSEVSLTPIVIRVGGEYEGPIEFLEGVEGKITFKIGVGVGLSKKGWAWVAQKVGPEALKRMISAAGESLTGLWEYLVAEGIVAAGVIVLGTVAGTLALTYLMAWVVADAKRKGKLLALSTWYVAAFLYAVFPDSRNPPEGVVERDMLDDCNQLTELGRKDAIAQARAVLRSARMPEADGSEKAALAAYREILLDADKRDVKMAIWRLERSLEEKRKQIAQE